HELARAVEILDREHRPEHGLEPPLFPLVRRDAHLEKLVVARLLDVDQVRYVDDATHTAQVLTDAEVGLNDRRHRFPPALTDRALAAARHEPRSERLARPSPLAAITKLRKPPAAGRGVLSRPPGAARR